MMPGGCSDPKPATPEIQHLADQVGIVVATFIYFLHIGGRPIYYASTEVKPQLERRENKIYNTFTAIIYRTQVVAGTNYFIKVQNSDDGYVHLRIFQALPHENQGPSLTDYQTGKTKDDPLVCF